MDIVDTHCHVVSADLARYPRAPLGGKQSGWATTRPVTADGMAERMNEAGITQSVLVQATTAYGYDNSYVLDSRAGARTGSSRWGPWTRCGRTRPSTSRP